MSEELYTVWINDPAKDISFKEFYNDFLIDHDPGEKNSFIDRYEYKQDWIDSIMRPHTIKSDAECWYNFAIRHKEFKSGGAFSEREFTQLLATYIGTVGIPIRIESISGWDPELIILTGNNKIVKKYLTIPDLDIDSRFAYYKQWYEDCGLKPRRKLK